MIVVLDIELLCVSTLAQVIEHYLPTAKRVRIIYGMQWILLVDAIENAKKQLPNIDVYWLYVNHPNMVKIFEDSIAAASVSDAPDEIMFMDPSTSDGSKLLDKYRTCV